MSLSKMLKTSAKAMIALAAPVVAPISGRLRDLKRTKKSMVLVIGGPTHTDYILERLNALGHRIALVDGAPARRYWMSANRVLFCDPFDEKNTDRIVAFAKRHGCAFATNQTNDFLLPMVSRVNLALTGRTPYSETAVNSSITKYWLQANLDKVGDQKTYWRVIEPATHDEDLARVRASKPAAVVVKIDRSQGSRGVYICPDEESFEDAVDAGRALEPDQKIIVEQWMDGRQFNVDAVVSDGKLRIHLVTEECFTTYWPKIAPCWFIFGLDPEFERYAEIERETKRLVEACDFRFGALHVEMKFSGGTAHAIDASNRMGADFPRYADRVNDHDFVSDYLRAMQGLAFMSKPPHPVRKILRYTNFPDHPNRAAIDHLAQQHAEETGIDLVKKAGYLIFTAPNVAPLRAFLDKVSALEH